MILTVQLSRKSDTWYVRHAIIKNIVRYNDGTQMVYRYGYEPERYTFFRPDHQSIVLPAEWATYIRHPEKNQVEVVESLQGRDKKNYQRIRIKSAPDHPLLLEAIQLQRTLPPTHFVAVMEKAEAAHVNDERNKKGWGSEMVHGGKWKCATTHYQGHFWQWSHLAPYGVPHGDMRIDTPVLKVFLRNRWIVERKNWQADEYYQLVMPDELLVHNWQPPVLWRRDATWKAIRYYPTLTSTPT